MHRIYNTIVYKDIQRYTIYAKIYKDIQRYTKIYNSIQRYTKIYKDIQAHINTFIYINLLCCGRTARERKKAVIYWSLLRM